MTTVVALLLLVAAAVHRPDVVLGLVVLGAVFIPLERRWPVRRQPVLREGFGADVVHFIVDQVLAGAVVTVLAIQVVPILEPLLPNLDHYVHGPLRLALAAVVGEVLGYWGHRAMHRVPSLWRLHAIHHSSSTMDWLAPNRRHVFDTALGQAASIIPLLAIGLSPPMVTGWFVLRRAQGLFVHANLRWEFPLLRWFVATPHFHHWHHSADPRFYDTNFAGQCPALDWLFGTLHMPAKEWPESYGLPAPGRAIPNGYLARLAWPFQFGVDTVESAQGRGRRRARVRVGGVVVGGLAVAGVASAITPAPPIWSFSCTATTPFRSVVISPVGVVVQRVDGGLDKTRLVSMEGTPWLGVGLRVVQRSGAPLTIRIAARQYGLTVEGAEGVSVGRCRRLASALTTHR